MFFPEKFLLPGFGGGGAGRQSRSGKSVKLMVQQCGSQSQEHGPGVALPGVVRRTREPSPPPSQPLLTPTLCKAPLQNTCPLHPSQGTRATPPGRGTGQMVWGSGGSLAPCRFPGPEILQPCSPVAHPTSPSAPQNAARLPALGRSSFPSTPPTPCESEANRFFLQNDLIWGMGWDSHWTHWPSRHRSSGCAHQLQPVGPRPVGGRR